MRNCLNKFVKHGGKVFAADSDDVLIGLLKSRHSHTDWIPDLLFNTPEPWLLDDLSRLQICIIGVLAHADAAFKHRLKIELELTHYHSPSLSDRTPSADSLFETDFGMATLERHFRTLDSDEVYPFLSLVCRTGSTSMIKLFIDLGIDVNGRNGPDYNLFGNAAAVGNMEIIDTLLEYGANGSLALYYFLFYGEHLPNALFRHILELLIENAKPTSIQSYYNPLLAVIKSSRALSLYPKAPEILLERKIFAKNLLGVGGSSISYYHSYLYHAILYRLSSTVDLLLQNGACGDAQISHLFDCFGQWVESCTWLTFAVTCGAASCAEVLIRHGADVTALDGAGRSAIQLANSNASVLHPQTVELALASWEDLECRITTEEDVETLAVVERALNQRFQGTKSIEDYPSHCDKVAPQPPSRYERLLSMLQKTFNKALRIFLTPTQTEILLDRLETLSNDTR